MRYIKQYEEVSLNLGEIHSYIFKFLFEIFNIDYINFIEHNKFETEFKTGDNYYFTLQTTKRLGEISICLKRSLVVHTTVHELLKLVEQFFFTLFIDEFTDVTQLDIGKSEILFIISQDNIKVLDKITIENFEKFKTTSKFDL